MVAVHTKLSPRSGSKNVAVGTVNENAIPGTAAWDGTDTASVGATLPAKQKLRHTSHERIHTYVHTHTYQGKVMQ